MSNSVYQNSGMQMPIFASANGNQTATGVDDVDLVDLHDIFSDYFADGSTENGAATAMSLTNGTAGASALSQQQQLANAGLSLPTGHGIKTSWHSGTLPMVAGVAGQQQQPAQAQQPQQTAAGAQSPAKRVKMEETLFLPSDTPAPPAPVMQAGANAMLNAMLAAQQQQQQLAAAAVSAAAVSAAGSAPGVSLGSSLTGRLGYFQQQGQIQQIQQQQQQQPMSIPLAAVGVGGVSLPLGGVAHGVVPGMGMPHGMMGQGIVNMGGVAGMPMGGMQWGTSGIPGAGISGVSHIQYAAPLQMVDQASIEEQMTAERRLRNREHAKRSRVRKKFMLESLQQQVRGLQKENGTLRMLVQKRVPQAALKIIDECCAKSPLFGGETEAGLAGMAGSLPGEAPAEESKDGGKVSLVKSDFALIESLTSGQQNFVLSDPRLPDNPIVFASNGFYELTGYTREQVLGRNCRFLQGPGTDPRAVDVIRTALANGTDATMCLLNYKADGTPFWNQFFVAALRDADNCIVNYVGVQTLVEPKDGASALEDKVNAAMPLKLGEEDDQDDKASED